MLGNRIVNNILGIKRPKSDRISKNRQNPYTDEPGYDTIQTSYGGYDIELVPTARGWEAWISKNDRVVDDFTGPTKESALSNAKSAINYLK